VVEGRIDVARRARRCGLRDRRRTKIGRRGGVDITERAVETGALSNVCELACILRHDRASVLRRATLAELGAIAARNEAADGQQERYARSV
jgi:hypothetical protein